MKKEINDILLQVMINPGRTYSLIGKWLSNRCGDEKYPEQRLMDLLSGYRKQGIKAPVGFFMYHVERDIIKWREELTSKKEERGVFSGVIKR